MGAEEVAVGWLIDFEEQAIGVFPVQFCCGELATYVRIRTVPNRAGAPRGSTLRLDFLCESCWDAYRKRRKEAN